MDWLDIDDFDPIENLKIDNSGYEYHSHWNISRNSYWNFPSMIVNINKLPKTVDDFKENVDYFPKQLPEIIFCYGYESQGLYPWVVYCNFKDGNYDELREKTETEYISEKEKLKNCVGNKHIFRVFPNKNIYFVTWE